jgi:hypothetical protein
MHHTITGVAASFDSTGGFVQWPNGQLMLVWNRKDGTAYGPDGRVTHTFNNRRWAKAHHTVQLCRASNSQNCAQLQYNQAAAHAPSCSMSASTLFGTDCCASVRQKTLEQASDIFTDPAWDSAVLWCCLCRKPPGALQEDISARLDEHLRIRFLAGSHELQLSYSCDGCQAVLSQQHGAVLPDRAVAQEATMQQSGQQPGQQPESHSSSISSRQGVALGSYTKLQQQQAQVQKPEHLTGRPGEGSSAAAAAIAGLPAGGEMQALLARARALMAATDLSQSEVAVDEPCTTEPEQAHVEHAVAVQGIPSQACQQDQEASAAAGHDDDGDLQAMMARARAALAATSAALQDLTV